MHLQELGPLSPHEVSTLALFLALVLVWLLRRPGRELGRKHEYLRP